MASRIAAAAAVAAAAVFAATGSTAQAAPGWTAEADLRDATRVSGPAELGFAQGGLQIAGWHDVHSTAPYDITVGVATRGPGSVFANDFAIPTTTTYPTALKLAVAPNGAAVIGWVELDAAAPYTSPIVLLARYRTPAGIWQPPVQLAVDSTFDFTVTKGVMVAIGDDGTALAGAVHLEPNGPAEPLTDARADVFVHPPAGGWDAGTRLSAPNRSVLDLELGVDAEGNATAAWLERFDEDDPQLGTRNTVVAKHRMAATGVWANDGSVADIGAGESVQAMSFAVAASGRAVVAYGYDSFTDRDTYVTRRATAAAPFDTPILAGPDGGGSRPVGAGVAPDGVSYVVIGNPSIDAFTVVRASGDDAFSLPKPILAGAGKPRKALLAFDGNDAFIAADRGSAEPVLKVTRWRSGAPDPEPSHDLDADRPIDTLTQLISDRDGSIVALWLDKAAHTRVAVHDGGAPRLVDEKVPSVGAARGKLSLRATFADAWSPTTTTWEFGDGATATGATVKHRYAAVGAYSVTARGRDALGNERTSTFAVTIVADTVKPRVTVALPRCKPRSSKRSCTRLRRSRMGWRVLRGSAGDASPSSGIARVEVAVAKRGSKTLRRTIRAKDGKWTMKVPRLAAGRWTFSARAVDGSGNVSRPAKRTARLR